MKRIGTIGLCLVAALALSAPGSARTIAAHHPCVAPGQTIYTNKVVDMLLEPRNRAPITGRVNKDTAVRAVQSCPVETVAKSGRTQWWYDVEFQSTSGWVIWRHLNV